MGSCLYAADRAPFDLQAPTTQEIHFRGATSFPQAINGVAHAFLYIPAAP